VGKKKNTVILGGREKGAASGKSGTITILEPTSLSYGQKESPRRRVLLKRSDKEILTIFTKMGVGEESTGISKMGRALMFRTYIKHVAGKTYSNVKRDPPPEKGKEKPVRFQIIARLGLRQFRRGCRTKVNGKARFLLQKTNGW